MTQQHTCHRLVCHLSQTLHFYCPQSCIAQQSDFSLPLVSNVALPPICNPVLPNCHRVLHFVQLSGAQCSMVLELVLLVSKLFHRYCQCPQSAILQCPTVTERELHFGQLSGARWSCSNDGRGPTPTLVVLQLQR